MSELRAFIAVPLPLEALSGIREFLKRNDKTLARAVQVRPIAPANIHLTLRFLGDISDATVFAIRDVIARSIHGTLDLEARVVGFGTFPNVHRPRVVWVGLDESSGALLRIQREIEAGLLALGLDPEDKPFRPHITVARVKSVRNVGELTRLCEDHRATPIASCTLSEVVLYQSILRDEGPLYRIVERCPFVSFREGTSETQPAPSPIEKGDVR